MRSIYILLLICMIKSSNVLAWRIEKDILIIEKGDDLSEISHSLPSNSNKHHLIWKKCIDTLFNHNTSLIYEGIQSSIDSSNLRSYSTVAPAPNAIYESKDKDESHFWDGITAVITLLSVILAAILADYYFNRNERRKIAFDLFSEFNASEMHAHRIKADNVLAKNLLLEAELKDASDEEKSVHPEYFRTFEELDSKDTENKRSMYMLLNFINVLSC